MSSLVYNEMLKIVRKKRLWVIAAIVAVLVALFTYAQYKRVQEMQERLGTTDWRTQLQQQIIDAQNRLNSSSISDEWRKYLQIRLKQQQYYLEHDINLSPIHIEPTRPRLISYAVSCLKKTTHAE